MLPSLLCDVTEFVTSYLCLCLFSLLLIIDIWCEVHICSQKPWFSVLFPCPLSLFPLHTKEIMFYLKILVNCVNFVLIDDVLCLLYYLELSERAMSFACIRSFAESLTSVPCDLIYYLSIWWLFHSFVHFLGVDLQSTACCLPLQYKL